MFTFLVIRALAGIHRRRSGILKKDARGVRAARE
jgi:hypothetical protein